MKPFPSLKMWKFQPKIRAVVAVVAKQSLAHRHPVCQSLTSMSLKTSYSPISRDLKSNCNVWPVDSSDVVENVCVCSCVVCMCTRTGVPLLTVSLVGKTTVQQEEYESYVGSEKWENQTL